MIFTEESINKVCEQEYRLPIVDYDGKTVIGTTTNKPTYSNEFLNFDGIQWDNGLEFVLNGSYKNEDGIMVVTDFKPVSCGNQILEISF